jgi:dTDP-6-deoxy-L-talose 4-dehydrogenase (NAD+)
MRKVALTGASGFIGRHVLSELAHHGVELTAVTRDPDRIARAKAPIRIVQMDLNRAQEDCFKRLGSPDVLIHLAWDGLPNYKSLHHFEIELSRQYFFLKTLIMAGLPSLVVTGTCLEYGLQSGALSENAPAQPRTPYGHAKDALRRQLEFLRETRAFKLTWARLFYMFGKGQSSSSLFSQLKAAVDRHDLTFNMSGGEQLRDYLPVEDAAKLIVELAMKRGDVGIVNVCSGQPVSVRKLVERWLHENDWSLDLNLGHYPYPDYEPMAFWGDRRRLDAVLEGL